MVALPVPPVAVPSPVPVPSPAEPVVPVAIPSESRERHRGRPRDERVSSAITDVALRQLAALGYAKMSMESVASEAGVSRATIYRRYRDKADLVTAAIAGNKGGDLPDAPSDDPRGDLERFLHQFDVRFAEHCLEVLGGLLGSREEPHAMALHRQRVIEPRSEYVRRLLVQAQELGQLDPEADVDVALHMLVGAVLARRARGVEDDDRWVEHSVDCVWRGLAPPVE